MAFGQVTDAIPTVERVLGFSREDLARTLEVHPRTIIRWSLNGDMPQRNHGRERLHALEALTKALLEVFGSDERVQDWLTTENAYLGLLTPKEALIAGRIDRVDAALEALKSGAWV